MPTKVKLYVWTIVAAGAAVALAAGRAWSSRNPSALLLFLALALLASFVKLRLPGMPGTYSMNFLFILAGVCVLSLPETILIGVTGAVAQSLWHARKRPTFLQIAFNMANLALTTAACYSLAHTVLAQGFELYRPAVLAFIAAVYFVVNTILVSGVLYLLEGKPLAEVCGQWYLWSFPYYLIGAALVGVLPLGGHVAPIGSWMVLLPLGYLLHFFYGLPGSRKQDSDSAQPERRRTMVGTNLYIAVVIGAGIALLASAVAGWRPQQMDRFAGYLIVAIFASGCKISLPGMTGTMSLGFVTVLVNIVELPFGEAIVISAVVSAIQCLWNPKHRPRLLQTAFSVSALVVSTGFASYLVRLLHGAGSDTGLPLTVAIATAALYGCNTALISSAIGLTERRPLSALWQRCYFYSFPYYLVGAAAASLMILTARQGGWATSMLVLPVMGLVYVSYRMHLTRVH